MRQVTHGYATLRSGYDHCMKKTLGFLAALSLALTMSACGDSTSEGENTGSATETVTDGGTTSATGGSLSESITGTYGTAVEWDDGTSVIISEPESFLIASESVAERYPGETVHAIVKVHNGTDEPLDLSLVSISATSGGKGAKRIDSRAMGQPTDEIAPGEDLTFDVGFEVQDPEQVTIRFDRNTGEDKAAYFDRS